MSQEEPLEPTISQDEPPRPRMTRRLLTKIVLGAFVSASVISLLLCTLGLNVWASMHSLLYAAGACGVACLAWEIVERDRERGGVAAWIAFPASWLFALGAVPFLALAVYPPLEEFLTSTGRVEAFEVVEPDGTKLHIQFPEEMDVRQSGCNLRFNSAPLDPDYYRQHFDDFVWVTARTLSLKLDPLLKAHGLDSLSVLTVNAEADLSFFHYRAGETVPQQSVTVRE